MSIMFQNMFPAIQVQTMKLESARRVVLFNLNSETGEIDVRHYLIQVRKHLEASRSVRRVLKLKKDLGKYQDIGDAILNDGFSTDTDAEDQTVLDVESERKTEQRAIKLTELGPRLSMSLIKIQDGFCDGPVLYHKLVKKTKAQVKALDDRKKKEQQLKAERRKEQEANVERKKKKEEKPLTLDTEDEESEDEEMDEDFDLEADYSDEGDEFNLEDVDEASESEEEEDE